MPLSEHEQKALEALEEAVAAHDPTFARRVQASGLWRNPRQRAAFSIVGLIAGLGLLLAFCLTTVVFVGVVGFLLLVASGYGLWNSVSQRAAAAHDGADRLSES